MDRLGFRVDPSARLIELSVAQRRWWRSPARCRATPASSSSTSRRPCSAAPSSTSSSTSSGGSRLEGVAFVYISHRLREVFAICDRVTVLRDGAVVGTRDIADAIRRR